MTILGRIKTILDASEHEVEYVLSVPTREYVDYIEELISPEGRICSRCKKTVHKSNFSFSKTVGHYMPTCKSCTSIICSKHNIKRAASSPESMIKTVIFGNMKQSTKSRNARRPQRHLTMDFNSSDELIDYLKEIDEWNKFCDLFTKYVKSGRDRHKAPSIDRLNNDIGYCRGNLRIITYIENTRAKCVHSTSNTTLTGKLSDCVNYNKNQLGFVVQRTYIIDGQHHYWKSIFPTNEIAIKYSTEVLDQILKYGRPHTKEIYISDWKDMWPDEYNQRRIELLSMRKINGAVIKSKNGYRLFIQVNNKKYTNWLFPTEDIARKYSKEYQLEIINGNIPAPIKKRDWIYHGLSNIIEFNKTYRKSGYTLTYRHDYHVFRAYVYNSSQEKIIHDMLLEDIRANNKITIPDIKKLYWSRDTNDLLNFTKHKLKHGESLRLMYKGVRFSAYINQPWQEEYVKKYVTDDIEKNGKITVRSIKKLDWAYIDVNDKK